MALGIDTARVIVEVVCADLSSRRVTDTPPPAPPPPFVDPPMGFVPPISVYRTLEPLHLAGAARNLAMIFSGMGPGDEEFDSKICIGIADATQAAIMANVLNGKLPKVQTAYRADRVVNGVAHKATAVWMKDATDYVFDWWPTLNSRNPLISTKAEWRVAGKSVEYKAFKGLP